LKEAPYTTSTGIQIGIRYIERSVVAPIDDPDMLMIQSVFINSDEYFRNRRLEKVAVVVSFIVGVAVLLFVLGISK
jgi:hypothetical protein